MESVNKYAGVTASKYVLEPCITLAAIRGTPFQHEAAVSLNRIVQAIKAIYVILLDSFRLELYR